MDDASVHYVVLRGRIHCGRRLVLERPADLRLIAARLDPMGAAEGREEIIERRLVREVQNREPNGGAEALGVKEIFGAESEVDYMAGSGPRRIVVIVLGSGSKDVNPGGAVIGRGAGCDSMG